MSSIEPGGIVQYEGDAKRRRPLYAVLLVALVAAAFAVLLEPYFVLDRIRDAAHDGDTAALAKLVDHELLAGPFRVYLEDCQPQPGRTVTRRWASPSRFLVVATAPVADHDLGAVSSITTLTLERRGLRWRLAAIARETLGEPRADVAPQPEGGPDAAPPAPPEALPHPGEFVRVEELPETVSSVQPDYPELARQAGVEGTVLVLALIDRRGVVRETLIEESVPMLDQAALEAVRQWRFKPATAAGAPVAVWVSVPVRFRLH